MDIKERVIIVEDGEYKVGYRTKYVNNSFKLEKKDKCFNDIINFTSVRTQSKSTKPKEIYSTLKNYYSEASKEDLLEIFSECVNGFDIVTKKEDLDFIYKNFISRVYSKLYSLGDDEKTHRRKHFLGNSYDTCPDLSLAIFVKTITEEYYNLLFKKMDNRTIRLMESLIITDNENDKSLDKIISCIDEKQDVRKDYYTFKKKIINNILIDRFDASYNHLCGLNCSLKYFDVCKKIHKVFWASDLTQFPCITDGYQVEIEDNDGKWKLDRMVVEKCSYKISNQIVPSKKLELIREKK